MTTETSKWVDISTVVAATAALWALGFAWVTYVMSVWQQKKDEFQTLKSVVDGLGVELEFMKGLTGAVGQGYSKAMTLQTAPPDWSQPGRLIWKFDTEAISKLTLSPYLYRLGDIVAPFARLSFSVSRLFQLYDEYRSFVNSNPGLVAAPPDWYKEVVLNFNFQMYVKLIGGADSDDPNCLYKTYDAATSALDKFKSKLRQSELPKWFCVGHLVTIACFASGGFLLYRLFRA